MRSSFHHEALDDVLFQALCCPTAEQHYPMTAYPVTDGQNQIQVVEVHMLFVLQKLHFIEVRVFGKWKNVSGVPLLTLSDPATDPR
jgi:hypothetical protein